MIRYRELANSVNINEAHITVYNPLPWKRDGLVILQTHSGNLKDATSLKDIASGRIIDLTNSGNIIRFIAEDVPAMGYKTYLPVKSNDAMKFRS